jgi:hypothetical protein
MPVATLLANFPASATYAGQYARVSDLYSSVDEIMRCRFDGTNYRWVPQREAKTGTTAATSGTVTITPLVTPSTIRATGSLLGNLTFNPLTANAYDGQRHTVIMEGALGLFTSTLTGLLGSNITLAGNNATTIQFSAANNGWFKSA